MSAADGIDLEFRPRSYQVDADADSATPPGLLGGGSLPRHRTAEFEIAQIVLDSTQRDTFSVRARRRHGSARYRYQLVDEYARRFTLTRQSSVGPLSLRELIHLIDTATSDELETRHDRLPEGIVWWQVHECGDPPEEAARFVRVTSAVYPDLERYYATRLLAWAREEAAKRAGDTI